MATFAGEDLYPPLSRGLAHWVLRSSKVTHFSMQQEDRHVVMEVFLMLNGFEVAESIDEQERTIPAVASGKMSRKQFAAWLTTRARPVP